MYGKPYKEEDTTLKQSHAHSRAMRKAVKIFLQHYWVLSRKLANLPVTDPYVKDRLDHEHIITWQEVFKKLGLDPALIEAA